MRLSSKRAVLLGRALALFLAVALSSVDSAWALRQQNADSGKVRAGLEERFRGDPRSPQQAGMEEPVLLGRDEVERAKEILAQNGSLKERIDEIRRVYDDEIVEFLKAEKDPHAAEIAALVEGPDGVLTFLALLGEKEAESYEAELAGKVEGLLDRSPKEIVENLEEERIHLFQEVYPWRAPGGDYNYPKFWDKAARKIYERYLRQRGDGYQSMEEDAFSKGLDRLQKFVEGNEAAGFVKGVIAYDPDRHYQQIKELWEHRHAAPYLSKEGFLQLAQELTAESLKEHPELLCALFGTYGYPSF